ncbi:MAG: hypothetical protein HUU15_13375 [Candidatus Brocadiae bacterium]|nr:hypothetical protein [Candidatus Brocadiia bacterium]
MKRALLAAMAICGCADTHIMINRAYTTDGYTVKGIHGTYVWSEKKQRASLTTGEGFEARVYTDRDGDGAADEVLYQYETFTRDQAGTSEMFRRADEDMDLARARYDIPGLHAEWKAMTPDERARREDYFK